MLRELTGDTYRTAFLFNKIGTYVSLIYAIVSTRPRSSATGSTHEKESNEDDEHPDCSDMICPPPAEVLQSTGRQSAYV